MSKTYRKQKSEERRKERFRKLQRKAKDLSKYGHKQALEFFDQWEV